MTFHPLTLSDREAMQAVTLPSGRRNCNYNFANLVGWQFWYNTEVCVLENAVVLRYSFDCQRAYMVCTSDDISLELIEALLDDSNGDLTLIGLEDSQVAQLSIVSSALPLGSAKNFQLSITTESVRNQYDYIYRRTDLATLHGRHLNAKRNHIHRFRAAHPDFEYRPLTPEFFDECRRLTAIWQEDKAAIKREQSDACIDSAEREQARTKFNNNDNENGNETIDAEHRVMETIFSNWDALGMIGGSIFVDGRMVAFTYGSAVTTDTLDVCVEKADRHVEGAFAIINQQFAEHLPEQYVYLNREEDMGIPGLRQAKLSYHPEILLTYNVVKVIGNRLWVIERMTSDDAPLTVDWMVRQYGFDRAEVVSWVQDLHFNWPLSVKALDENGNVIGLLNMSDYRIEEETPQIMNEKPELIKSLNSQRYIAVFSFIVAEKYRGTRLNYDMLMSIMPELKNKFDFIFIPVLHHLKTHQYWQRWGAKEFYRDEDCVYYKLDI